MSRAGVPMIRGAGGRALSPGDSFYHLSVGNNPPAVSYALLWRRRSRLYWLLTWSCCREGLTPKPSLQPSTDLTEQDLRLKGTAAGSSYTVMQVHELERH